MKAFKPGDRVRVIAGPRAGLLGEVASELIPPLYALYPAWVWCQYGLPAIHSIRTEDGAHHGAPPAWLEPYYDGKEKSDITDWRELLPRVREEA